MPDLNDNLRRYIGAFVAHVITQLPGSNVHVGRANGRTSFLIMPAHGYHLVDDDVLALLSDVEGVALADAEAAVAELRKLKTGEG